MKNRPMPLSAKFWAKVDGTRGYWECWLWTGAKGGDGYGMHGVTEDGRRYTRQVHRLAYTLAVGEIPDGLTIDHLCRNRLCCNPNHLEVVSIRENILRGDGVAANNARKTHCPRGHEYTEENTYVYRKKRHCRECGRRKCARDYLRRVRES